MKKQRLIPAFCLSVAGVASLLLAGSMGAADRRVVIGLAAVLLVAVPLVLLTARGGRVSRVERRAADRIRKKKARHAVGQAQAGCRVSLGGVGRNLDISGVRDGEQVDP